MHEKNDCCSLSKAQGRLQEYEVVGLALVFFGRLGQLHSFFVIDLEETIEVQTLRFRMYFFKPGFIQL